MYEIIDLGYSIVYILWWAGIAGLIETCIQMSKVNNYIRIAIYLMLILVSFLIIHFNKLSFR